MPTQLLSTIPPAVWKLVLVLFLSFLIGLEREELKQREGRRLFGGVRTFPLLGLVGYSVALLANGQMVSILVAMAVVGAFLALAYWHKLTVLGGTGVTTEVSGLLVYLVGALVHQGHVWFACALVVVSLLLLELKEVLEGLADKMEPGEILAVAKFLMLTAVILPLVPNHAFGPFALNPFKTWLVVVAVSGVSYASYVILRITKGKGGVFLSALLGGLYSSTVTTVVLARRANGDPRCHTFSGAILAASGMMYLRVLGLIFLFNRELGKVLTLPLLALSFAAILGGWLWHRLPEGQGVVEGEAPPPRNPLELRTAFLFAVVFLAMLVITHLVVSHLGHGGVYALGAIMGVADVDPYIMGMTSYGVGPMMGVAAAGILIATGANNLAKGSYAAFLAKGHAGRWSLMLLGGLALLGLLPLFWL